MAQISLKPSDFELIRELGRGGMAVVHEALHKQSAMRYAIKSIDKYQLGAREWENLQREVEIMRGLDHGNVLKMHAMFQSPSQYHLVLDLMPGGELFHHIVARGSFAETDAREIVGQILSGVAYLHANGIAHRDLKPENLLINAVGGVVISDFGLSKYFARGQLLTTRCGTPAYVAPEVIVGDTYSTAVDLWSVGVITYVLLSGVAPFYGDDEEMFAQITAGKLDFPADLFGHVSLPAVAFIRRLLQVEAAARPSAAEALVDPWFRGGNISTVDYSGNLRESMNSYIMARQERCAGASSCDLTASDAMMSDC